ncbi:hypothetical protein MP638_002260 [Amoeboaphelidium occidentale]|nr:hypothetical protein MP638_002260 [Amoeboaphelidium occidentale]
MDLDLNMRVDENEMPKTFTTDGFLSMSMVEYSGVAVDVGDLGGIGPSAGGKKRKEPEGGKRCKCGSTEHQRICNKNCPLYKPRLKLQYRDTELPEKTVTTTTGLNSVLRIAPLKDIIMDAVARCTDIQVEVSRLLNGYVIWMIEENRPIPDLRFSDGIMREFYQAIVSTPSINEYMDEIYSRCRPDHLAWNDSTKLGQLLSNMARMHSTNCQNHVVTNLLKWIKKWLIWKRGKQLRAFLCADDFNEVVTVAMNEITRTEEDEGFYAIPLNIIEADILKTDVQAFENENGIHGRGLRLFSLTPISTFKQKFILIDTDALHDLMTSENIGIVVPRDKVVFRVNAIEWWPRAFNVDKLTTATKRFGFSISTNGVEYHQHNMKQFERSEMNDWGLRLFSLIPISTFKQKFILIDTDALHDLMTSENIGIVVPRDKVVFRVHAMEWWRRAFNVDKLTTATKRFGFSISTNGVEYHQHNMKQFERSEINDWGYNYEGEFIPLEINGQTRVVALDPGRNSLYVAVSGKTAADVLECSNSRWQEISGTRYSTKKANTWITADRDRHMAITLTPTPSEINDWGYNYEGEFIPLEINGQTRVDALDPGRNSLYVAVAGNTAADVLECSNSRWQEISGTRYSTKKANTWITADRDRHMAITLTPTPCCSNTDGYITHLLHELAAGAEDVVIAYGGGGFSHNSRGHPPTPNKHLFLELKRRTRCRLVPEFRTSKLCSKCDNELVQSDIWTIKSCNNNNCRTRWNRDVNGARNIRRVFLYMNANGGRKPPAFRRGN